MPAGGGRSCAAGARRGGVGYARGMREPTGWGVRLRRWLGRAFLRLAGWEAVGAEHVVDKGVIIAAPHTSNWDGVFMLAVAWAMDLRLSWMVKDSLTRGPLGWLVRATGGIGVDRSARHDTVEQLRRRFERSDRLLLAIAPSGTRGRRDHWRSGFYHVARAAGVPILLGFLDYARRRGGIGGALRPTGDLRADMDRIRAFYAPIRGKHPELESRIRLKAEDPPPEDTAPEE